MDPYAIDYPPAQPPTKSKMGLIIGLFVVVILGVLGYLWYSGTYPFSASTKVTEDAEVTEVTDAPKNDCKDGYKLDELGNCNPKNDSVSGSKTSSSTSAPVTSSPSTTSPGTTSPSTTSPGQKSVSDFTVSSII